MININRLIRRSIRRHIVSPFLIRNYLSQEGLMRLHVGAGNNYLDGWLNTDIRSRDKRVIYLDATKSFPFGDNTFDFVFTEHFLEHLDYPFETQNFISECFRVMKGGGIARISVPDTEYTLRAYMESDGEYFERCRRLWHPEWCTTKMESVNFHFRQYDQHKFAYDYETLKKLLEQCGFLEITQSECRGSESLELRVDSRTLPGTLYVECKKLVK